MGSTSESKNYQVIEKEKKPGSTRYSTGEKIKNGFKAEYPRDLWSSINDEIKKAQQNLLSHT